MEKKDIVEIIKIAEIVENKGHHELHDALIKLSVKDYALDNGKISDPWERQLKPTNWIDAISNSFLQPATKAAMIEAFRTQKGQKLLWFLNMTLQNMLKGKAVKDVYIPGYATDASRATGPAGVSDPYAGYEKWMTPGTSTEGLQNLATEKQGYTEIIQKMIQNLGDEAIMRMIGNP